MLSNSVYTSTYLNFKYIATRRVSLHSVLSVVKAIVVRPQILPRVQQRCEEVLKRQNFRDTQAPRSAHFNRTTLFCPLRLLRTDSDRKESNLDTVRASPRASAASRTSNRRAATAWPQINTSIFVLVDLLVALLDA